VLDGASSFWTDQLVNTGSAAVPNIPLWMAWRGTLTGWDGSLISTTTKDAPMQIPTPAGAAVTAPGLMGMIHQFIGWHDGTIDPTMHKIEYGISA
jgi:hypothetical protein